jgi:hypothetical protein
MVDVEAADQKIQALIKSRGGDGVLGIARNFRIIDVDRSGFLNFQEFSRAMELFRAGLSPKVRPTSTSSSSSLFNFLFWRFPLAHLNMPSGITVFYFFLRPTGLDTKSKKKRI